MQYAFFGIRCGVLALILKAMWGMLGKCRKDCLAYGIMLGVFGAVVFLKLNVLAVLTASALIGLTATQMARRAQK